MSHQVFILDCLWCFETMSLLLGWLAEKGPHIRAIIGVAVKTMIAKKKKKKGAKTFNVKIVFQSDSRVGWSCAMEMGFLNNWSIEMGSLGRCSCWNWIEDKVNNSGEFHVNNLFYFLDVFLMKLFGRKGKNIFFPCKQNVRKSHNKSSDSIISI